MYSLMSRNQGSCEGAEQGEACANYFFQKRKECNTISAELQDAKKSSILFLICCSIKASRLPTPRLTPRIVLPMHSDQIILASCEEYPALAPIWMSAGHVGCPGARSSHELNAACIPWEEAPALSLMSHTDDARTEQSRSYWLQREAHLGARLLQLYRQTPGTLDFVLPKCCKPCRA